jgi:hypothetical protein
MDGVARQGDGRGERKRKLVRKNLEALKDVYVQLKNLELRILRIMEQEEIEELEDMKEQEEALANETIHQLYQRHVKENRRSR